MEEHVVNHVIGTREHMWLREHGEEHVGRGTCGRDERTHKESGLQGTRELRDEHVDEGTLGGRNRCRAEHMEEETRGGGTIEWDTRKGTHNYFVIYKNIFDVYIKAVVFDILSLCLI